MALTAAHAPVPAGGLRQPLLRAQAVAVSYGQLQVLRGVDFDVWEGELVALTGENGAGKSTLVRCIAGDILPAFGDIVVGGTKIRSSAAAANGGVAVVWQDAALCDNLDVAGNLFLGHERGRWFLSEPKSRLAANALLDSYGIRVGNVHSVGALSSGQRQLIAVARAMHLTPRLLVLDEPTASLGVHETRQVEELIKKLKAGGTTILLVSHDIHQVFHLADRILVLHRGRVAADLVPSETHPEDVVAIMSGHAPDATARRQLARLQSLVDQLASAEPSSSLPLINSALASALSLERLCIHLIEDRSLRLVAADGLPPAFLEGWAELPVGRRGGPMGWAAETGRIEVDEDIEKSPSWSRFSALGRAAGIRSSWAVPLIGADGLIGVITGCQPFVGPPRRDQMDLVSLYAGYAAGAIERDRLFAEVTARNRVLETIREVLETLAGPNPVPASLLQALQSLQRGLRAAEVELWSEVPGRLPRCTVFVDADNQAHQEPSRRDGSDALIALSAPAPPGAARRAEPGRGRQAVATTFETPGGRCALLARWLTGEQPEYAFALLADAAHSVRLALERQESEQAHQQAAALRRSHQLQRDFLSRLSHELRTPLTAIRGYASSLLAPDVTWDEDSTSRFLGRIASESARLGRLVGDLLDFSAIESGLLRLQPDWCDLALVIEAAVSCLPPERAAAITVDCSAVAGPVWADHDRLEQVFVNLLDNAVRHNRADVHVEVRVSPDGDDAVAIVVADDGQGLPAELEAELRERGGHGAANGAGGAGARLGLSIARAIVAAHSGRMELEEAGAGTRFRIVLPVEAAGEAAS
ncbi:MAG: ATP-binding cassette domain-containing protein [Acidimicrobiales bacterium]